MAKEHYNPWPLGKLPKEWQRPEPELIKQNGYHWDDPRDIIGIFEQKLADFAGSKYAVVTDCCSHAIYLTLKYIGAKGTITIPSRSYISIPMQILHVGCDVAFEDIEWSGQYQLKPYPVYDAATRFTKGMYTGEGTFQIISFQIKKRLPIGKGGVILTNDEAAYKWLKLASYDGRDLNTPYMSEEHVSQMGWHYYMTPEDAARGILIMDKLPEVNEDTGGHLNYFDLSAHKLFKKPYSVYDVTTYSFGEPPVPFTKLTSFKTYEEARAYVSSLDGFYYIEGDDFLELISGDVIYESPDGGKTIYERKKLNINRKQIK